VGEESDDSKLCRELVYIHDTSWVLPAILPSIVPSVTVLHCTQVTTAERTTKKLDLGRARDRPRLGLLRNEEVMQRDETCSVASCQLDQLLGCCTVRTVDSDIMEASAVAYEDSRC